MAVIRHNFLCPDCECDLLEEVSRGLTYSMIDSFYSNEEPHSRWWPEWFDTEHEELEVLRYQCRDCGFVIHEGYCDDLYSLLKRKGWIVQGRPALTPSSDWEV